VLRGYIGLLRALFFLRSYLRKWYREVTKDLETELGYIPSLPLISGRFINIMRITLSTSGKCHKD
jgi:hypothetical protein